MVTTTRRAAAAPAAAAPSAPAAPEAARALAPPTPAEAKAHNRRKLIEALTAGLPVDTVTRGRLYFVASATDAGSWYRLPVVSASADHPRDFRIHCSCHWGHHLGDGWAARELESQPCKHMLLLYWLLLAPEQQETQTTADPALAAAWATWIAAQPLPPTRHAGLGTVA